MTKRPTLQAMFETAEAVRTMRDAIDAHLRGAMSDRDLRELAQSVPYAMTTNVDARLTCLDVGRYASDGSMEIRRSDLEVYARELAEGLSLHVEERGATAVAVEELARRAGVARVNRVLDGLGIVHTVRFASPATGRSFTAWATPHRTDATLCLPRGDAAFAFVDLVESFLWDAIEAPKATMGLDLDVLPEVALLREDDNGNRVEIRTFRSYAGAMREARRFEDLGHKQRYWVEVVREPRW
ncbi:MAG: hypothetical protein K1X94_12440 [Sandaracinaceae bacterium]|nr:hypothetical protein [Sandaracinaceae bacterium]